MSSTTTISSSTSSAGALPLEASPILRQPATTVTTITGAGRTSVEHYQQHQQELAATEVSLGITHEIHPELPTPRPPPSSAYSAFAMSAVSGSGSGSGPAQLGSSAPRAPTVLLRSQRDWFIWINTFRALFPQAWPYMDPDKSAVPRFPHPGSKPRPQDMRNSPSSSALTGVEGTNVSGGSGGGGRGSPISMTSTAAEDWDLDLSAFRSLSADERAYFFHLCREHEAATQRFEALQAEMARAAAVVLASIPPKHLYMVLGVPLHTGLRRLAGRYKPTDSDVSLWLTDLTRGRNRPTDRNWEEWLDQYLAAFWAGRQVGAAETRGEEGVKRFLVAVEHLTETWAATWRKKMDKIRDRMGGEWDPDVMDMADDWRQWMEFRRDAVGDVGAGPSSVLEA